MISYNIAHISTMNAVKYGLKRSFSVGTSFVIRVHDEHDLVRGGFLVQGELKAMFYVTGISRRVGGIFTRRRGAKNLSDAAEGWIEKFIKCSVPPKGLGGNRVRRSIHRRRRETSSGPSPSGRGERRCVASFDETARALTDDVVQDFPRTDT